MKKARGLSERASDIVLVAITAVVLIIVAYPLYYVLIASVSDPYDVYAGKTFLFPSGFTLDGYAAVFQDPNIVSGFLNSVKYTVIGTVFSVTMLYITAYPMAQRDLPGRKFLSIFFLITMYFGGGLVPTYLVVKSTGLVGSMWSLFLPGGVAVGNMILVRNYFQNNIPKDLIEAANGKPVLVAYWFKHDLERIRERFTVREIKTSGDIADWNQGKIPVAVIHPASAGHGLNLQSGGSTLVWFGLTWSLELYQQTNARLWRQGQKDTTVVIHHIITKNTIDERIMSALQKKERAQSALINAVKADLEVRK